MSKIKRTRLFITRDFKKASPIRPYSKTAYKRGDVFLPWSKNMAEVLRSVPWKKVQARHISTYLGMYNDHIVVLYLAR